MAPDSPERGAADREQHAQQRGPGEREHGIIGDECNHARLHHRYHDQNARCLPAVDQAARPGRGDLTG